MVWAKEYLVGSLIDDLDDCDHAKKQGNSSVVFLGVGGEIEQHVASHSRRLWLAARWVSGS